MSATAANRQCCQETSARDPATHILHTHTHSLFKNEFPILVHTRTYTERPNKNPLTRMRMSRKRERER